MAAIAVEKVQCVVIGAGVVGLACARRISERGIETLVSPEVFIFIFSYEPRLCTITPSVLTDHRKGV
jgi:malic enzyme